jgi:hypothetical protein
MEGALLHMKGASLIRPKLHCGKTRSTCIARVSIRTVPLPRSRFENHFPESLFVKIVSQKGQNENFTLATLSSNGKKMAALLRGILSIAPRDWAAIGFVGRWADLSIWWHRTFYLSCVSTRSVTIRLSHLRLRWPSLCEKKENFTNIAYQEPSIYKGVSFQNITNIAFSSPRWMARPSRSSNRWQGDFFSCRS